METKDSSEAITSNVRAGAILDTWSSDPWTNGVQIEQIEDMQKLFVQSKNSLYEITVIFPEPDATRDQVVDRTRPVALFDFLGTINRIPEEEH